jgi:hypothetical protein
MAPAELLQEWRAELLQEQTEFEQELAQARKECHEVEAKVTAIRGQLVDLLRLSERGLSSFEPMSAPLYRRVQEARFDALRAISNARGGLMIRIKSLQERIAGRRLAINQIDRALDSAKVKQLRPAPDSLYRKPKPVEFDNITMPQEVVR